MNRALVFGIAIFFAVVGIALMGGETKALAGHGCHGCDGCDGGCDGGCHGDDGCNGCDGGCHGDRGCRGRRHGCKGRSGLFSRLRSRKCCGDPCCGAPAPSCCGCAGDVHVEHCEGTEVEVEGTEEGTEGAADAATEGTTSIRRTFRAVSFRR